jgi:hypothetical protein
VGRPQFPDEIKLTATWRPKGDEKAPRSGGQAAQWSTDMSIEK